MCSFNKQVFSTYSRTFGLAHRVLSNRPCPSVYKSLLDILETNIVFTYFFHYVGAPLGCKIDKANFGPWIYLTGSTVITLVCGLPVVSFSFHSRSVCLFVFECLRDHALFFSETLHEVGDECNKKVTWMKF